MTRECKYCLKEFEFTHFNRKKCESCITEGIKSPFAFATKEEIATIRRLSVDHFKKDVAKMMGKSWSWVGRVKRRYRIKECARDYPKELVKKVSEYHSKHGFKKTCERFPDVSVKSLQRYFLQYAKPRQIRWKPHEHLKMSKMAGLISPSLQAKVMNRPRAFAGSIKSYWYKNRSHGGTYINGLPSCQAVHFLFYKDSHKKRIDFKRQPQANENQKESWRIVLWTDLARHCKPTTPPHIKQAFQTMAKFQCWLHGTRNVRCKIKKMLQCSTPETLSKLLMDS